MWNWNTILWQYLLSSLALVMILEGIFPFLKPGVWRKIMITATKQSDQLLRIIGLISMFIGVLLLYIVN